MSTKMYNFYRWTGNIFGLQTWLEKVRRDYLQETVAEVAKFSKRIPDDQLWDRLSDDTKAGLNSPFNIAASAVIYLDNNQIYVQFFGVRHHLYEAKIEEGILIDCHYQNQTDQPEYVSDEEWERREELVERLLDKHYSGVPSSCGLSFLFASYQDCMYVSHLVQQSLNLVGYMVKDGTICIDCSPEKPEGSPNLFEIDMDKNVCIECKREYCYGQWRAPKTIEEEINPHTGEPYAF